MRNKALLFVDKKTNIFDSESSISFFLSKSFQANQRSERNDFDNNETLN